MNQQCLPRSMGRAQTYFRRSLLTIVCYWAMTAAAQDLRSVEGVVKDEKGIILQGVTVSVEGSKASTATDKDGHYKLTLPAMAKIIHFSFVGYETKKVDIGGQTTIDIVLAVQSGQLSDVVVTGYGKALKREVTGSISSVAPENFTQGVISSPAMLLEGKVAGLLVSKSGNPNQAPTVILRGPSTLRTGSAQSPFYVVDGVPGASIDLIAPDDIESVDVLKDGASTAIYGSRAANGVIMITTRKARVNQTRVVYSAYVSTEKVAKRLEMLTGDELRKYLSDNGQKLAPANNDSVNGRAVNTDWQKTVEQSPVSTNHNLSVLGNSKNTAYGFSINYLHNPGLIKGTSLDRFITRFSIDHRVLNDRVRLGLSATNTYTKQEDVNSGVYSNMLNYLPTVLAQRPDGSFTEDFTGNVRGGSNPLALIAYNTNETKTNLYLVNGLVEVKILPGLKYTASIAAQRQQANNDQYNDALSTLNKGTSGHAYRNTYTSTSNIIESYFNYDRTFGLHDIKLLGGYSWQETNNGDGFGVNTQGFVSDALAYNNLSLSNPPNGTITFDNNNLTPLRLISFYGRVNYAFDSKYLLQGSLRKDGSSAFGANNRWGYFPSVSAGWRISSESFLRDVRNLNDLKLRASYGISGNSLGFDPLIAQLQYGPVGRHYENGQYINSIAPNQNANPNLKWERTSMLDIGVDVALFGNRLSASVDYYNKNTSDLIWQYPVSVTQFISTTLSANAGTIHNRGIELVINATPVKTPRFTWNTSINLAHNKNDITSLANSQFKLTSIPVAILGGKGQSGNWSQLIQQGSPLGTFDLWHYLGKDSVGVSTYQSAKGGKTTSPSTSDLMVTGANAQPQLIFGFNNTFNYRNFDLGMFFHGVTGNKILNATLAALNTTTDAAKSNLAKFSLHEAYNDKNAFLYSDRFLESGSYLRLENLSLGYTFHFDDVNFRQIRLYGSVNNVFTVTSYRGIDPEINIGGLTPGIDNRDYYPKTRSFILGMNVQFK
ncbi:SusC/RagA family TonB-linked outer membrane protein [Flavitalea sp. BT771]|uniref:SusC/RagA family TonB-linked outer membrane protein n=1 Tax=Flavitalea sp. BT771 TaxID=3063329 RepID=UPI0026E45D74|nr:SusC/RagA family TonB-linked outer membrane protein [Flavitalea sp. BT771]MDO6432786.1 SusC/RagA family TonB-linked outer membrane protein [Flavitalea sp. BT771]MDV6221938.1 SusC/RagA family TonB-linked outer membrane protein [Flavitalea sp. BT771]